ncbi:MAG: VTT domain-containing protein [Methanobacteriota archaeon]
MLCRGPHAGVTACRGVPGEPLCVRAPPRPRGSAIGGFDAAPLQFDLGTADPLTFLVLLFAYSVAAAVALPIPVEFFLLLNPSVDPLVSAAVLGLGKGAGAIVVFYLGYKINPWIERWMGRHSIGGRILKALEAFVRRTGWVGLLILLAIPFMSDTAVNYFYALLNEEGHAVGRWSFVVANVVGGTARALLFLWVLP